MKMITKTRTISVGLILLAGLIFILMQVHRQLEQGKVSAVNQTTGETPVKLTKSDQSSLAESSRKKENLSSGNMKPSASTETGLEYDDSIQSNSKDKEFTGVADEESKSKEKENKEIEGNETDIQAKTAFWKQEVEKFTTEYYRHMEDSASIVLELQRANATQEEQSQRRTLEQKREELLGNGMTAILQYLNYSGDYAGVNSGGWVDQIWGYYVKVQAFPPSGPKDVPKANVLTPLVIGY